jgi:hypothetical protein
MERWDEQVFMTLSVDLCRAAEIAAANGIQVEIQVKLTKGEEEECHVFQSHEDGVFTTPHPNLFGCHRHDEVTLVKDGEE